MLEEVGADPIALRERERNEVISNGKSILVTGGTGSMGKTSCGACSAASWHAAKSHRVLARRSEAARHADGLPARASPPTKSIYRNFMNVLEFRIGDVRDYAAVCCGA